MKIQKMRCVKCGHEWIPRVENPVKCPSCQHPMRKIKCGGSRITVSQTSLKTPKQIFHKHLRKHDMITKAFIEANKEWIKQKREIEVDSPDESAQCYIRIGILNELLEELEEK